MFKARTHYQDMPREIGREREAISCSMSSGTNDGSVKITVIDTQFVRTDPIHFKTVVQSLTGKASMPAGGVALERPRVTGGRMPLGADQFQRIVHGSIAEGAE